MSKNEALFKIFILHLMWVDHVYSLYNTEYVWAHQCVSGCSWVFIKIKKNFIGYPVSLAQDRLFIKSDKPTSILLSWLFGFFYVIFLYFCWLLLLIHFFLFNFSCVHIFLLLLHHLVYHLVESCIPKRHAIETHTMHISRAKTLLFVMV